MVEVIGALVVVLLLAFVQWRRRWSRLRRADNAPARGAVAQEHRDGREGDGR